MMNKNPDTTTQGPTSSRGDGAQARELPKDKPEVTPAPAQKKSWWDRQSPEVQVILTIAGSFTGFVLACAAVGAATDAVRSASARKTMNSPGFKNMLDRGLLDPVAPPKTLEEAAARVMASQPHILSAVDDHAMLVAAEM